MVKRVNIKTTKNSQPVEDYLDGLDSPAFSEQGYQLLGLFSRVTGCDPKMWGRQVSSGSANTSTTERMAMKVYLWQRGFPCVRVGQCCTLCRDTQRRPST